jgi:hypothetical protein
LLKLILLIDNSSVRDSSREDKMRKVLEHTESYDKVTYFTPDKKAISNKVKTLILKIFLIIVDEQ